MNTQWAVDYFSKNPLKTTKLNSYYLWMYLRKRLLYKEILEKDTPGLIGVATLINDLENKGGKVECESIGTKG